MQRTSFAPVLSATLSRDSCWITWQTSSSGRLRRAVPLSRRSSSLRSSLLRSLHDLHDSPALGRGQRTGLHQLDPVAGAAVVVLVVGLEPRRTPHDLAVERVLHAVLDLDHDGLVHLVAHDQALTHLAGCAGRSCCVLAHASAPSFWADSSSLWVSLWVSLSSGSDRIPSSRSRTTV